MSNDEVYAAGLLNRAVDRATQLPEIRAFLQPAGREWYRRLGHLVIEESAECLTTEGGFRSEYFSEPRLQSLVGDCTISPCAGIAYTVIF